jgi:hypothetical protein
METESGHVGVRVRLWDMIPSYTAFDKRKKVRVDRD